MSAAKRSKAAQDAVRTTGAPTVVEIIADGLDAVADGRGFGGEHLEAVRLANGAPALRDALIGLCRQEDWEGEEIRPDSPVGKARAALEAVKTGKRAEAVPGLCYEHADLGFALKLEQAQNKAGLFTVTYGKQVTRDLTYSEAAAEYGSCLMHALACEGRLDNEKGTR